MSGGALRWVLGVPAAALTAAVSFLSVYDGGRRREAELPPPADGQPGDDASLTAAEQFGESVADAVSRGFRALGARGDTVRGRVEGYYGLYRLMKTLGLSEADIAALVARQARSRVERQLRDVSPTADEVRRTLNGLEEVLVVAAQEVDERMNLGGDFVRRVRDAARATRPGREDALLGVERAVGATREQLRRILKDEADEDSHR